MIADLEETHSQQMEKVQKVSCAKAVFFVTACQSMAAKGLTQVAQQFQKQQQDAAVYQSQLQQELAELGHKLAMAQQERKKAIEDAAAERVQRVELSKSLESVTMELCSLRASSRAALEKATGFVSAAGGQIDRLLAELEKFKKHNTELKLEVAEASQRFEAAMGQVDALREQLAAVGQDNIVLKKNLEDCRGQLGETLQELWEGKFRAEPATQFLEAEVERLEGLLQQKGEELEAWGMWAAIRQPYYLEAECNKLREWSYNAQECIGQWQESAQHWQVAAEQCQERAGQWQESAEQWEARAGHLEAELLSLQNQNSCSMVESPSWRFGAGQQQEANPKGFSLFQNW
jgi:chromosome segregation ATPase